MSDKHNNLAKDILHKIIYATVATSSQDGKPWNTPVRYVYDSDLNLYWFSDKNNQHSRNVRANEDVFIVIYDSTVADGRGEGIYLEAKAYELDNPDEIRAARRLKRGADTDAPEDYMGEAVRRVYKAVPNRAWINDAEEKDGVFVRDLRIEIPLAALRNLLEVV